MLKVIQEEHKLWQRKNFGALPPEDSLFGIMEELGELAHAITKNKQHIRINENHEANAKDAVGDIAIFLISFCTSQDWDFKEILLRTWNDVKQRDWKKFPEKGVKK